MVATAAYQEGEERPRLPACQLQPGDDRVG
jgi:hypothetical protein